MIMIGARKIGFWPVIGARCGGPTSTERVGSPAHRVQPVSQHLVDRTLQGIGPRLTGGGCTRSVPPLTPRTARRPHRGSRCRTAGLRAHSGIAENQEQRGIFTKDTAKTARRPADQIQPPGLQRSRPRNLCHTSLIVENAVASASFHDHRPASAHHPRERVRMAGVRRGAGRQLRGFGGGEDDAARNLGNAADARVVRRGRRRGPSCGCGRIFAERHDPGAAVG